MSKTVIHHRNATAEGAAMGLVLVVVLAAAVLASPGALVVFVVDRLLDLALDAAQLWTFAVLVSLGLFAVLAVTARGTSAGLSRFLLVALAASVLMIVARFGFHAEWPRDLWRAFAGGA